MTPEDRLRDALAARATEVEPGIDGLDTIESRLAARGAGRASPWRRRAPLLAVAALAAVVVAAVAALPGDDTKEVATSPSTTGAVPRPSTTIGSTVPVGAPDIDWVWPLSGVGSTSDPEGLALDFARKFLGMSEARVVERNASALAYVVQPFASGGPKTTVTLQRVQGGRYFVVSAQADSIELVAPAYGQGVSSPIHVEGQGTAFEATLNYRVYAVGSQADISRGDHIVMAGSNGEVGPFADTIPYDAVGTDIVLVLFEGDASGRGDMSAATVVRLRGGSGTPASPADMLAWTDEAALVTVSEDGSRSPAYYRSASPLPPAVAWSPDHGTAYVADRDHSDASSCGRGIRSISTPSAGEAAFVVAGDSPAVRADGGALAYAGCDGAIHVRDLVSGSDRVIAKGDCTQASPLGWSDDSKLLAVRCAPAGRGDDSVAVISSTAKSVAAADRVYGIAAPGRVVGAQFLSATQVIVAFDNTAADNGTAGFELLTLNDGENPVRPAGDVANGIRSFAIDGGGRIAYVDGDGGLWIRSHDGAATQVGTGYAVVDW